MESWVGWELGRLVLLYAVVLYLGIWVQVTLMHWRAAFRSKAMWGPVVLTPVIAGAGVLGLFQGDGALGGIAVALMAIGVAHGLAGLIYHLRGTSYMVGGINLRNLLAGPPPILPVAYSLAGVAGLMALLLHD